MSKQIPEPEQELIPPIWARRFLAIFVVTLALALAYLLRNAVMPFLLAWIAAYLASPLVDLLDRKFRIGRNKGVVIVMAAGLVLVVIFLAITIPIIVNESMFLASSFPAYRDRVMSTIAEWRSSGRIHPIVEQLAGQIFANLQESAPRIATRLVEWLLSHVGSVFGIIDFALNTLLFFFITFYFLKDFHGINRAMIEAVPVPHRSAMRELFGEIDTNLRTVLRGQFLVALTMSFLYSIGLSLAGVPYAILIGIIAGMGNFLPYVGPMLGMIPAFVFVLLHSGGQMQPVIMSSISILVVFGIVQFLEGFVLTPRIAGHSVGLGPVAVLFAVSAGGALFGFIGVVAALPSAAIAKVLLRRAWDHYKGSLFFQGEV